MKPTIAIHKSDPARPYAESSFHISTAALHWFGWINDVKQCRRRVNEAESHASIWVFQTSNSVNVNIRNNRQCDQVQKAACGDRCTDWATSWATWGSKPDTVKTFYPKSPERFWGPHNNFQRLLCQELSSRDVDLTTHFHLVTRLRIRGVIPPDPLRTFKACEGKIFL
jgi:hypothetical protein